MNDSKHTSPDLLEVIDSALTAALREIRKARATAPVGSLPEMAGSAKRTSNVNLCLDVLGSAGRPLHISSLHEALQKLGVTSSRDSIVSALTKRLAPNGPFIRTEPNTFGLAIRDRPKEE